MATDPNARRRAQTFWKKVKDHIDEQIGRLNQVMEVVEVTDQNQIRARAYGADSQYVRDISHVSSVQPGVGDRVVVTEVEGHLIATSVLRPIGSTTDLPSSGGGGQVGPPGPPGPQGEPGEKGISTALVSTYPPQQPRDVGDVWYNPSGTYGQLAYVSAIISDTEPANPETGMVWIDP